MKRLGKLMVGGILALFVFVLSLTSVGAQNPSNFTINSFAADYYLSRDQNKTSQVTVREEIVAQFPDIDQNHGILRALPSRYNGHTLSLKVDSVKDDAGNNHPYSTYSENDNLVLKIGDADRYVHGATTYIISYSMRNVAQNLAAHDEFYWDINGDQWGQIFESVIARVHIASELSPYVQDRSVCYAGEFGQTNQDDCVISLSATDSETIAESSTTRPLNPYETLTVALGFEDGTFEPGPEIAREERERKIKLVAAVAAALLPPLIAVTVMYRRWRALGDDPSGRGIIVPEYEPPKGFNTLTSDFLLSQKLRHTAVSAAIVELAIGRYLNIHEIPKKGLFGKTDYQLEIVKMPASSEKEKRKIIDMIFLAPEVGALVKISEIKKSVARRQSISEGVEELEDSLSADLHQAGLFAANPKKIKRRYILWATGIFGVGFALAFIPFVFPLGVGIAMAAVVVFAFAFYMPARTLNGVTLHDHLLGLKDYIGLAEKDRLQFGQSPEGAQKIRAGSYDPSNPKMKIKLFESLLPYAMLFGMEKQWGKQFEGIYAQPPQWYSGHHGAFNAAYLGSSLNSFSSASSTTFSSPSSSSGSGFSGGSSGGGGGGGGGGGW